MTDYLYTYSDNSCLRFLFYIPRYIVNPQLLLLFFYLFHLVAYTLHLHLLLFLLLWYTFTLALIMIKFQLIQILVDSFINIGVIQELIYDWDLLH